MTGLRQWWRLHHLWFWLAIVTLGVLLGLVALSVVHLQERADQTAEALDRARQGSAIRQSTIDLLQQQQEMLRDQILGLGEEPAVPEDAMPSGPPGPAGPPGRAPTVTEVMIAVQAYLQANPPPAGRPPNDEEIAAAVASYCSSGLCEGPEGPQGGSGPAGPQGPGPSDEQIAAAVAAWCGDGRCQGDPGPQGEPGATGPRGSQGPAGEPPLSWTFTAQGNRTFLCTRTSPFDPDQPTYRCERTDQ